MIGIINYGSGNIYAIANIYNQLGISHKIISDYRDLKLADKLILPGVGAFDETMSLIKQKNFLDELNELVLEKNVPIIGVCVGMQILASRSHEGKEEGFGWIKGKVKKLDASKIEKKPFLPHMGWNSIKFSREDGLFTDIDADRGFYFLHSYYFECENADDIMATTSYGEDFTVAVNRDNVFGLQFHPEKSHKNGLKIFENFANA